MDLHPRGADVNSKKPGENDMATQMVPVCWTPTQPTSHAFLDGKNTPYPNDIIPITEPTTFTFVASKACSTVDSFTMRIAPVANDITVVSNGGQTIVLEAKYAIINQNALLNMTLIGGGRTYTIESGRPIIRNDPHRTFNPVYVAATLVLLVGIAYVLWRLWRRHLERSRLNGDLPRP
jgi:hypothetical protein